VLHGGHITRVQHPIEGPATINTVLAGRYIRSFHHQLHFASWQVHQKLPSPTTFCYLAGTSQASITNYILLPGSHTTKIQQLVYGPETINTELFGRYITNIQPPLHCYLAVTPQASSTQFRDPRPLTLYYLAVTSRTSSPRNTHTHIHAHTHN
jgi:hypothetical protein